MNHQKNFQTLCRAVQNCDAALLECVEATTGKNISLVCAVNKPPEGLPEFVPLAKMLDEPFQQLIVPVHPADLDWTPDRN